MLAAAPPEDDAGGVDPRATRIPEEHHVDPLTPQVARPESRQPVAPAAVEHLHLDRLPGGRNGEGVTLDLVTPERPNHHDEQGGSEQDARGDQPAARGRSEFQNRTVGSGSDQPDSTACPRRIRATSLSTPPGSVANRAASAARSARLCSRPGSR